MWTAALVAIAVFVVPGAVIGWCAGLRVPWAVAASVPVTAGVWGALAWIYGHLGVRYTLASVAVGTVVTALLCLVWRLAFVLVRRRRRRRAAAQEAAAGGAGGAGGVDGEGGADGSAREDATPADADGVTSVAAAQSAPRGAEEAEDGVVTDPGTPATADGAEPASDPGTDPATDSATDPATAPGTAVPASGTARPVGGGRTPVAQRVVRWFRSPDRHGGLLDPMWLLPVIGVVAGVVMLLARSVSVLRRAPGGLENIYQGWDVHWHASVIRYIMDTGLAGSDTMGPLQNVETGKALYYPTGWHAMGAVYQAVTGLSPVATVNITGIVLPSLCIPATAAFLGWLAVGKRGTGAATTAGLAAVIVTGLLPVYFISYYVGAWPYLAGMGMVGIVVALFAVVPARPVAILPAALAFAGAGVMHPSVATVVVMLVGAWWLLWRLWAPALRPGESVWGVTGRWSRAVVVRIRDVVYLAAAALIAAVILVPQWLAGLGQAEEVDAFSDVQPVDRLGSWKLVLELQSRHAIDFGVPWVVLWAAAVGMIVLLVWRRALWVPVAYLLFAVVAVHSVKNFDGVVGDLSRAVGSMHYNTTHRLIVPVALLTAVAAAAAVAGVIRAITGGLLTRVFRRRHRGVAAAGSVTAVVLALAVGAGVVGAQERHDDGWDWSLGASREPRVITDSEMGAFRWLTTAPKAYDGLIAGNPAEGTGWMYPLYDLPSLHRHFLWPTVPEDSATNMVFWHPDLFGSGLPPEHPGGAPRPGYANVADFAARDLGVNYYISSPPSFFGFQKDIPEQVEGLMTAPGTTPVYKDGRTVVYAVNAAFTDEELEAMRRDTTSPDPLPPLRTQAERPGGHSQRPTAPWFPRPETWDRAAAEASVAREKAREEQARAARERGSDDAARERSGADAGDRPRGRSGADRGAGEPGAGARADADGHGTGAGARADADGDGTGAGAGEVDGGQGWDPATGAEGDLTAVGAVGTT
ncbi:hypothetical protein CBOVI_02125 [Corynebacterium bovis DSM 20582 = CIP 54.80]|nr:hypothetical protein CBOVI_02125 [Corynebacterium bovis DSM 20582 = CIP 54.80]